MTRRFWIVIGSFCLLVLVGFIAICAFFLYRPLITEDSGVTYVIAEGSSIHYVIDDLTKRHIIKNPYFFKLLVRIKGVSQQLKAGNYLFLKGISSSRLLHQITTGTGLAYQTFMIVPGNTFKDIRIALQNNMYVRHTMQNLSNEEIMEKLGAKNVNPEGEFFPDTYFFREGSDDMALLKRAFKKMQEKLKMAWQKRSANLPFKTDYEALIAASIIEKEAYFKEELPIIAGVLVNRLKANMLLQFDPTIIYGAPHSDRTIRRSDLLDKNPYNTYQHKGLPPTPIAMPSLRAIEAVLHPIRHHYYYFVAEGNKSSRFSQSLKDHNKAVEMARKSHWFFNYAITKQYLRMFFLCDFCILPKDVPQFENVKLIIESRLWTNQKAFFSLSKE